MPLLDVLLLLLLLLLLPALPVRVLATINLLIHHVIHLKNAAKLISDEEARREKRDDGKGGEGEMKPFGLPPNYDVCIRWVKVATRPTTTTATTTATTKNAINAYDFFFLFTTYGFTQLQIATESTRSATSNSATTPTSTADRRSQRGTSKNDWQR